MTIDPGVRCASNPGWRSVPGADAHRAWVCGGAPARERCANLLLGQVIWRTGYRRDAELVLAPPVLLLVTLSALAVLLLLRSVDAEIASSALPVVVLLLVGRIVRASRRFAVSQSLGFLVLENGLLLYTVVSLHAMPLVVERGALTDVLVGPMRAGVLPCHIRDSFEPIDVTA